MKNEQSPFIEIPSAIVLAGALLVLFGIGWVWWYMKGCPKVEDE